MVPEYRLLHLSTCQYAQEILMQYWILSFVGIWLKDLILFTSSLETNFRNSVTCPWNTLTSNIGNDIELILESTQDVFTFPL